MAPNICLDGHLHTASQDVDDYLANSANEKRDRYESTNNDDPSAAKLYF